MSDFSPEVRNSAIWSGDSRKVANGKANEVILTKQGKMPIPDLSGIEAVQMGHVMEPVIGRLVQERLGIELTKIEESLSHPKHDWFKSHFDFAGKENGETVLVEAKNYNAAVRNKFDDSGLMPAADLAQVIHEAAVFGVRKVYLAVLFGGQELVLVPRTIEDAEKEELIKRMAEVWGHVQAGTQMQPEDLEQIKAMFPTSVATSKMASASVEEASRMLAMIKGQIKGLEKQEEALQTLIQGYMGECDTLTSIEGQVLATWKQAKASLKFDAKRFEQAYPQMYDQFKAEVPGSRRFLIK